MKEELIEIVKTFLTVLIGAVVLVAIIIFSCLGMNKIIMKRDKAMYNGGVCDECGGRYIYREAVGHRFNTNYIYICDECGKMIELDNYLRGADCE